MIKPAAAANVRSLIERFPDYLAIYDRQTPFRRAGQLELHVATLRLRAQTGSAFSALEDQRYLTSLYATLQAWGIGKRGSVLVPFEKFCLRLRSQRSAFAALDGQAIDDPQLDVNRVVAILQSLIKDLGIVQNNAPLVASAKAIHHILPELVAPIDRAYTRPFFGWYSSQFQYHQLQAAEEIFRTYHQVAVTVGLGQYVNGEWRTARSKLLDNAVVGYCIAHDVKRS